MMEEVRYKKINWFIFILFVLAMFVLLLYFDRAVADAPDARTMEVIHKTMNAMGGLEEWKSVMALRFNFQVEPKGAPAKAVKHLWDRRLNRDHVEGTKDNKPMVAWINLTTKKGMAWFDGKELAGDDLNKAMEWAYGRWVNDSYWVIMPFKLLDDGTSVHYMEEKDGHDVLHLSFGKVGLTPGDQYFAYINTDTGLMDKWEFLLQGGEKGTFQWLDWTKVGNVRLSTYKKGTDGTGIRIQPLKALDSADPSYFGKNLKVLPD
jgi:hypothetical protein